MNRFFLGCFDMFFVLLFFVFSLLLLGGLVVWLMVLNIEISFLCLLFNFNIELMFVGVSNYVCIFFDFGFWYLLWMMVWYIVLVVVGSIVFGLVVVMFFNCEFCLCKIVCLLVIFFYVMLFILLVFVWKYMFNNGYGIVNYFGVDFLYFYEQVLLWFDNLGSSFVLVVLFVIWCYFLYVFILFLVILQIIDKLLYEVVEMDGVNVW